jgi:hypothetical protein
MLKYKILIKLHVLSCLLIRCVYGDIILKYKKYVHVCVYLSVCVCNYSELFSKTLNRFDSTLL